MTATTTTSLLSERRRSTLYVQRSPDGPRLLKILNSEEPTPEEMVRFYNDLEMTRDLDIVGVRHGLGKTRFNGRPALTMEYVEGEAMGPQMVEASSDLFGFLEVASEIARILGEVHERNIIHRDVKPENIIFNASRRQVTLIDFGISSRLDLQTEHLGNPEHLEGTLAYISPEQTGRMNRVVDYRTDLYSFGATLYQLLTGVPPFQAHDPMQLVHCHLAQIPVPVRERNPLVPEPISDIVAKLLAKNAEDRYQSAFGVKHDLDQCREALAGAGRIARFPLAQQDISGRFQLPQKLYGRERELEALLQAFRSASEGAVEIALVAGYAGVGKSALVHEVHKPITETRGYFLQGKFDQLQRNIPYSAPIQAFRGLVDILLTEGEDRLAYWKQRILDAVGSASDVLTTLVPEFALIIGEQPEPPELSAEEIGNRLEYALRRFIQVLSAAEHPLVLFIDDLQWADAASLNLFKTLLSDQDNGYVLFIGAYRDNEVTRSHPLTIALDELRAQGARIGEFALDNLTRADLGQLLADALNTEPEATASLAAILAAKTEGNPFAVVQLLRSLYEAEGLVFESTTRRWQWDVDRIRQLDIPDNVVDLLAGRIRKFTGQTQHVLQLASCIGNRFELSVLAGLYQQTPQGTLDALWAAIDERLIVPLDNAYRVVAAAGAAGAAGIGDDCDGMRFRFAHDRVQQAAYSLIAEDQRKAAHRRIGKLLLEHADGRELRLFDIVNHLNFAIDLLDDGEAGQLAGFNVEAGRLARQSAAHVQALRYFQAGLELLPADKWTRVYDRALELSGECAQSAYATGDFERVYALAEEIIAHARAPLDSLLARETLLRCATVNDSVPRQLDLGLEALRALGVTFPAKPTMAHVMAAFARSQLALASRRIKDIADDPGAADPTRRAAMLMMERILAPAFRSGSHLFKLLNLELVNQSLKYGHTAASAQGFAGYTVMLTGVMRSIDTAYEIGEMSLRLARRYGRAGETLFVVNIFVRHWKEPIRHCVQPLQEAYQLALEGGRPFDAAAAACYHLLMMQASGVPLAEVETYFHDYGPVLQRDQAHYLSTSLQQFVANLLGAAADPHRLVGEYFDEARVRQRFAEYADKTEVAMFCSYKVQLCFLFGAYDEGLRYAEEGAACEEGLNGMAFEPVFRLYAALTRLALYRAGRPRPGLLRGVKKARSLMRKWAMHGPDNHLHRYQLLEAEYARTKGANEEARNLYENAIRAARASQLIPEEALTFEQAGEFYRDIGQSFVANAFFQEALGAYAQWGAKAKVQQLRDRFPHLMRTVVHGSAGSGSSFPSTTLQGQTTGSYTSTEETDLDMISLIKASHAISAEIVMDRLLAQLIQIVVENAGAQQGTLFLLDGDVPRVQARCDASSGAVSVMQGTELAEATWVSEAVVNYVMRTREHHLIEDASADERLSGDAHVQAQGVRSILCMPVMHQGKLTGVLYLENNVATGAFTAALVEVLKVLAAQAAVSLENARLYGSQVELTAALRRFVPNAFLRNLRRDSIAEVQLGDSVQKQMSILFSDMRSFTSHVEGMSPEENIGFINTYLRHMEPCISRHGGFVDSYVGDAIMALFDGDPDNAVASAIEMLTVLKRLNMNRGREGRPEIAVGIGINTGLLTLGTIGSVNRIKCGVIGDCVNLAARVESQTKYYAPLLISDQTVDRLRNPSAFHMRIVDRVRVVGRTEPVTFYEVFDADAEEDKQAKLAVAADYERAIACYYRREFDDALRAFNACREVRQADRIIAAYMDRCHKYRDMDLDDAWTGVEDLTYK